MWIQFTERFYLLVSLAEFKSVFNLDALLTNNFFVLIVQNVVNLNAFLIYIFHKTRFYYIFCIPSRDEQVGFFLKKTHPNPTRRKFFDNYGLTLYTLQFCMNIIIWIFELVLVLTQLMKKLTLGLVVDFQTLPNPTRDSFYETQSNWTRRISNPSGPSPMGWVPG